MSFIDSARILGLDGEDAIIAVSGCGGKSTFIQKLAQSRKNYRVLITPTTKIYPIIADDVLLVPSLKQAKLHQAHVGIQCMGQLNSVTGKLESLPLAFLAKICHDYDLILLEADGSRALPAKGWRESEPVIPDFVTHTLGIATLQALHQPANEHYVLNLADFLAMTGLKEDERITLKALYKMISAKEGLFKNSRGKRYLFLNQIEESQSQAIAKLLLAYLKREEPPLAGYLYGSARLNRWQRVGDEG